MKNLRKCVMKVVSTILFLIVMQATAQPILTSEKTAVAKTLDEWHKAAAIANFDLYFSLMTTDGVFIGTDPTENWQNKDFKAFARPFFDKGKAWNFTAIQRNIYFSKDMKTAYFDELLDTQMKICRGSGILQKHKGLWKIAHYVLSIAIPNEKTDEIVKIKADFDNIIIQNSKKL